MCLSSGPAGGELGTHIAGLNFLLLHTVGRKSGHQFVIPISYFAADGYTFLVGSNWGSRRNAAWYYNLLSNPHTTIEVRGRQIHVQASQAEGREYDQMWQAAVRRYPGYARYQARLQRSIPIVKLVPEGTRTENRE